MKEKILEFLKQQEGFISGQRICDELGVSRTAVWKYMNSLKKEGYEEIEIKKDLAGLDRVVMGRYNKE